MSLILKVIILFLILGTIFLGGAFPRAPFLVVKNWILSTNLVEELAKADLENQSLRAEISRLTLGLKPSSGQLLKAKIYSSYPFNDKSLIVLAKGASEGIRVGDIVLAARNVFLGQVVDVGDSWSEVRTVFDISKNIPVRIGTDGIAALLIGGPAPIISMIDKSRAVANQDLVYLASRDLPYGLVVGEISNIREPSIGAFKQADVLFSYSLVSIEEVLVVLKPS